jgi:hypothetical protein
MLLSNTKQLPASHQAIQMNAYSNQPFYVVTDDAYERMLAKLQSGESFVKTYLNVCPHKSEKECKCVYYKNTLKDGMIIRGEKPVIPVSTLLMLKVMSN